MQSLSSFDLLLKSLKVRSNEGHVLEGESEVPEDPEREEEPSNGPHNIGTPVKGDGQNIPTNLHLEKTLTDNCSHCQPRESTNAGILVTEGEGERKRKGIDTI